MKLRSNYQNVVGDSKGTVAGEEKCHDLPIVKPLTSASDLNMYAIFPIVINKENILFLDCSVHMCALL